MIEIGAICMTLHYRMLEAQRLKINSDRKSLGLGPIPRQEWFKACDMASDFCLSKDRPWTWKNHLADMLVRVFRLK